MAAKRKTAEEKLNLLGTRLRGGAAKSRPVPQQTIQDAIKRAQEFEQEQNKEQTRERRRDERSR